MRKSNYDKMPATVVDGTLWKGWESIRKRLAEIHAETNGSQVWVVECYQGVHHEELMRELQALAPDRFINTQGLPAGVHLLLIQEIRIREMSPGRS